MHLSPFSFTTALSESFPLTIIRDVFSLPISTFLLFSQVRKPILDNQLLLLDCPQTFQQLKADALKCDTHYWECQGEKTAPSGQNRQSASTSTPASDAPKTSHTNLGIGVDGKLTQEEWEHRQLKGICYYCGLTIDLPSSNSHNSQHPKPPAAGCTTFTITGEPEVTIEEVVEGPLTELENKYVIYLHRCSTWIMWLPSTPLHCI